MNNFNLIITWHDERSPLRLKEYIYSLEQNIKNDLIEKIFILVEEVDTKFNLPKIFEHSKINYFILKKKRKRSISYNDVIKFGNENVGLSLPIIISNTDIYFDKTLDQITSKHLSQFLFALTRVNVFETRYNNTESIWVPKCWSQDVWIYLNGSLESKLEYEINLGWLGCDNRIAYELDKNLIKVVNPAQSINCYHYHSQNEHAQLNDQFSYKYDGKGFKYLELTSIKQLDSKEFKYSTLSPTDRFCYENHLTSYNSKISTSLRKKIKVFLHNVLMKRIKS